MRDAQRTRGARCVCPYMAYLEAGTVLGLGEHVGLGRSLRQQKAGMAELLTCCLLSDRAGCSLLAAELQLGSVVELEGGAASVRRYACGVSGLATLRTPLVDIRELCVLSAVACALLVCWQEWQ